PMSGCASSLEISVVFPLPRKPVTSATGVSSAKRPNELGVERIERPAGQARRLDPERAEIADHGAAALAVSEHVDAAAPVAEVQPVEREHAVHQPEPKRPPAPAAL